MKLQFLWDEDKTRTLFKTHLVLFLIGGIVASIYTLFLPPNIQYRLVVILVPVLFTISCLFYLLLLERPRPGIRFLIFTLEAQFAAAIFMAVTGGFLGIVQFAPYMFLLFAVFELGTVSTLILGGFSILTFLGVLVFSLITSPDSTVWNNFFYYVGSYILILIIERNIGRELSLQFEAKRKLEEIDDVKNQFMALASHYLRTPLTIIKGFALELEETGLQKEQEKYLIHIRSSAKDLETLIEKILLISTIQQGKVRIAPMFTDLGSIVSSVVSGFLPTASERQVKLLYIPPSIPLPLVEVDRVSMREVIVELVDNAVKFNKTGGTVTVSTVLQGPNIVITIEDTGQGISKERMKTLFTPLTRGTSLKQTVAYGKGEGIGLSLYLAKLITKTHHGNLTLSSTEGEGATFTITLPIRQ